MTRPIGTVNGFVHIGDTAIRTLDLVAKIRRFRGRLTRGEICTALGYTDEYYDRAYKVVCRLCATYQIPTKIVERDARPATVPANREQMRVLLTAQMIAAKRSLAAEIAAHRNTLALGRTPRPYKNGPLRW